VVAHKGAILGMAYRLDRICTRWSWSWRNILSTMDYQRSGWVVIEGRFPWEIEILSPWINVKVFIFEDLNIKIEEFTRYHSVKKLLFKLIFTNNIDKFALWFVYQLMHDHDWATDWRHFDFVAIAYRMSATWEARTGFQDQRSNKGTQSVKMKDMRDQHVIFGINSWNA